MYHSQNEIDISLVTWNSASDLPVFLDSLAQQTYTKYKLIIIDNYSTDNTRQLLKLKYNQYQIIENKTNLGYAAAHNIGIKKSSSPFVLIANPDIRLEPKFLEELIKIIRSNNRIGSVGGKLVKMNQVLNNNQDFVMIDSTGFKAFNNRRFIDRGEGEKDIGQYNRVEEVFGISGALVLFRKEALEDVRLFNGQYFDERYFMYQEDIDLAWRLRQRNWTSYYVPLARAWHRRSVGGKSRSALDTLKNRKLKSPLINQLSYRNHWWTIIKNETASNLFWWFPWIFIYELKKLIYIILFEPRTIFKCLKSLNRLPEIIQKRRFILKNRLINTKELRKWFN